MKWIGQHIWDLTSRFRNDVYLETLTENFDEFTVVIGNDNKLYKSTAPSEKSRIQVRNDEGSTIPAGSPLYSKGEIGGSERILVGICVSSDPAKMPCIGIAEFEMNTTDTKDSFAITQGVYNTNIHGFTGLSEGDILYVNGGVAPHLTKTKPTNGDLIQNVGVVLKTNGTICQGLLVSAIGRTNDVPWPLYVDHTTQRVGIGTSSPTVPFHVIGDARIQGNLTVNGTYTQIDTDVNTTEQWLVTNDGTGPAAVINQLGTEDIFDVQDDGTSVFYIEDGGNIGIGTTNPAYKLSVNGDVQSDFFRGYQYPTGSYLDFDDDTTPGSNGTALVSISSMKFMVDSNANSSSDAFSWIVDGLPGSGTTLMTLLDEGYLGIGTSSPSEKLHVNGNGLFNGGLTVGDSAADTFITRGHTYLATAGNNVGIGTTTASDTLTINAPTSSGISINNAAGSLVARLYHGGVVGNEFGRFYLKSLTTSSEVYLAASGSSYINSGNVGIGTSSPSYKLDIDGQTRIQSTNYEMLYLHQADANGGFIKFTNTDDTDGWYAGISGSEEFIISRTADNSAPIITAEQNGNVGIGTSSPSTKLHIEDSSHVYSTLQSTGANTEVAHKYRSGTLTSGYYWWTGLNNYDKYQIAYGTSFDNAGTALCIDTSGNVGIGTTSPSSLLHIEGSAPKIQFTDTTTSASSYIDADSAFGSLNIMADQGNSVASSQINLLVDGSSKMVVKDTGNVGIGTTSPTSKLHVVGDVAVSTGNFIVDAGNTNKYIQLSDGSANMIYSAYSKHIWKTYNGVAYGERMTLTSTGELGIGTSSPSARLEVSSDSSYSSDLNILSISGTKTGGTAVTNVKGINVDIGSNDHVAGYDITNLYGAYINNNASGTSATVINNWYGVYVPAVDANRVSNSVSAYFGDNVGIGTTSPGQALHLPDNKRIAIGTGQDSQWYHDGSNTYLKNATGDLYIQNSANDKDIIFQSDDGSGGLATYLQLDGSSVRTRAFKDVNFDDSVKATFGASSDLQIYHNGGNSFIDDVGAGDLRVRTTSGTAVKIQYGDENMIQANANSSVDLYYDNSKKLETTSTGVEVTGDVVASGTLIAKQYQAFQCNFINDISTTKYYLPLDTVTAQTVVYQDEACMLAHADGRLASVTLKVENLNGASGNITFGIEVLQSTGTGYSGTWTVVETETMAIASTHNHDVFHFHFSTAKHFDSTHMFAISIQSDNAALGGEGGNDERWFVTPVIEWDYNTYLGTNGTSTRYDTTP